MPHPHHILHPPNSLLWTMPVSLHLSHLHCLFSESVIEFIVPSCSRPPVMSSVLKQICRSFCDKNRGLFLTLYYSRKIRVGTWPLPVHYFELPRIEKNRTYPALLGPRRFPIRMGGPTRSHLTGSLACAMDMNCKSKNCPHCTPCVNPFRYAAKRGVDTWCIM